MNGDHTLARLKDLGLAAWQAEFAKSFLGDSAKRHQILVAPPGTGKSTTGAAIVASFAATRSVRVLVLIPGLALRAQWAHQIRSLGCPSEVLMVDQKAYRQVLSESPIDQTAWDKPGVYILSMDFARKSVIASGLKEARWDLVVVDDAERMTSPLASALLQDLIEAGGVGRLLLLSSVHTPALSNWIKTFPTWGGSSAAIQATEWTGPLLQWDGTTVGRPEITLELVSYRPGPDELDFVRRLQDAIPPLRKALGPGDFLTRMLSRRAASSLFAAEQSLRTLRRRLTEESVRDPESQEHRNRREPDGGDTKQLTDTSSTPPETKLDPGQVVSLVDGCLDSLELVESDAKLAVAKQVIRRSLSSGPVREARVCVLTGFTDTASYVATALTELDARVQKLTGSMSDDARRLGFEQFRQTGGILVCTDATLEGMDLSQVRDVLHYDLPGSDRRLDQRLGRFLRFGRTTPGRMYLLCDETDSFGNDTQRLLERIRAGWEPMASPPDEDSDTEE